MILTYAQCIDRYGTDYKVKKEIKRCKAGNTGY